MSRFLNGSNSYQSTRAVYSSPVKMADRKIVSRGESFNDSSVKNKWRWEWTEATHDDEKVSKHIRKLTKAGHALCLVCDSELNYGSRGRVVFEKHLLSVQHKKAVKGIDGSSTLSGKIFFKESLCLARDKYDFTRISEVCPNLSLFCLCATFTLSARGPPKHPNSILHSQNKSKMLPGEAFKCTSKVYFSSASGGLRPPDPPTGRCPCTPPGAWPAPGPLPH